MAGWTADQDAALFRLYVTEGHSASQTARLLPGPARSRNAVIGRAHRLGFATKRPPSPTVKAPYPKRQALKARRSEPAPHPVIAPLPVEAAPASAKPWIEREFGECAFPVGDVTGADQLSCCNPCGEATYCAAHMRVMYSQKPKPIIALPGNKPKRSRDFKEWAA